MQPCGVTHGQMQHQEPAFHEELALLMRPESGSGISHTGDGWTGTWRHGHSTRIRSGCHSHGWISARSLLASASCQFQQAGVCVSAAAAAAVNLALRSSQKLGFQLEVSDGDKSLQALAPPDDHGRLSPGSKAELLWR